MKNLAGVKDCDRHIRDELERAQIEIIEGERSKGEVAATLTGKLGPFTFERAWYYWMVHGPMPLEVAREMYEHHDGRRAVRAGGHACAPPPEGESNWRASDGREVWAAKERAECLKWIPRLYADEAEIDRRYAFSDDPASIGARRFVEVYHIDTQEGLDLFAETVRRLEDKR